MMIKKHSLIVFCFFLCAFAISLQAALAPLESSGAYRHYAVRKNTSELSKLLYLFDRFREGDFQIRYGGRWYDADWSMKQAREYLQAHYHKESAEQFIKQHAYRPLVGNEIVYIQFPDQGVRLLRDVLLEELAALRRFEKISGR